MAKLFMVPISREICRSPIILFGLIIFLLLPCTLAAQGPSDLQRKAEQGDARSQFDLGLLYKNGKGGFPQDYKEAIKWYLKAAEQGNAIAQTHLGVMYDQGEGVTQDYKEAFKWYLKAAEQGNAIAQTHLGVMYDQGEGVPQDDNKAVKWYRKAAEQGNEQAKKILELKGKGSYTQTTTDPKTGNVTTEVNASGNQTSTVKDKNGQLISTTTKTGDGKGGYTSVTKDNHGNV